MSRWSMLALAAAILAAPVTAGAQPIQDVMAVRTVRFYRADTHQTLVRAFVQIPYVGFSNSGGSGTGDQVTYFVTVRVSDSAGLGLLKEGWTNHFPRALALPGVVGLEMLEFPVLPGAYVLDVTVEDSVTGWKASTRTPIEGFRSPPAVSDLLLSPEIRIPGPSDTVPKPGELRIGNALVTGVVELKLTPLQSEAYYLLEVYSAEPASGTLSAAIRDSSGTTILQTPPTAVNVLAGGGCSRGSWT